jgi:RNA polymerase sigma factor (TIGR02999 family)
MADLTQLISEVKQGDGDAGQRLLLLVYQELRKLAAAKLAREKPGHTLEATALVHEAYLRLVGNEDAGWQNRGHFFAAAAEAMRRILVDHARAKKADKRGGDWQRISFAGLPLASPAPDDLLLLDETLGELTREDPVCGKLVELRYFAGLSVEEAAAALGISAATAYRHWSFARAWLYAQMGLNKTPAVE